MSEHVGKPEAVAADAAYKTPAITNYLITNEITPALPYTRQSKDYSESTIMCMINIMIVTFAQRAKF